jgi:hypothetical protein
MRWYRLKRKEAKEQQERGTLTNGKEAHERKICMKKEKV